MSFSIFFFFKQKTAYDIRNCDWSSDVCSSDLETPEICKMRNSDDSKDAKRREDSGF